MAEKDITYLSGCYSQIGFFHLPIAYQRRLNAVDRVEYLNDENNVKPKAYC